MHACSRLPRMAGKALPTRPHAMQGLVLPPRPRFWCAPLGQVREVVPWPRRAHCSVLLFPPLWHALPLHRSGLHAALLLQGSARFYSMHGQVFLVCRLRRLAMQFVAPHGYWSSSQDWFHALSSHCLAPLGFASHVLHRSVLQQHCDLSFLPPVKLSALPSSAMTWTIATALQVTMAEDSDARVQALRNLCIAELEALHADLNDARRTPAPGPAPTTAQPAPAPGPAPAQHRDDEEDADYQWHAASHRPARGGGYQNPPGQHRSGLQTLALR